MQTFMPYPDYESSAKALDYRRLGKQRVECKQIFSALRKQSGGWVNHPATKMWRGYEVELATYAYVMCREWVRRGYNDTLMPYFLNILDAADADGYDPRDPKRVPPWLGDDAFHASHRSNLLRKDPIYYSRHKWTEPDDLDYVWPV